MDNSINIGRLQKWFSAQCNGDWEHGSGVKIESLDNPGWIVKIDLIGTSLENKTFKTIAKNVPAFNVEVAMGKVETPVSVKDSESEDWLACYVRDGRFEGAGDASKLDEILSIFLHWTESTSTGSDER